MVGELGPDHRLTHRPISAAEVAADDLARRLARAEEDVRTLHAAVRAALDATVGVPTPMVPELRWVLRAALASTGGGTW